MTSSMLTQPIAENMGRKYSKESIHSGHFMVSDFEAEAQDEEGLEVPEQQEIPETVEQVKGVHSVKQGDVITYAKPTSSRNDTIVSIDASLTKLFNTMSIAYRQNITSPKWNRFKGLKLRWKDKIRLNNVIWRCWHLQFVLKKKMRVCPFALDVDIHTKPETTLLEGKYWKRRIEAVTAEYKKWRAFYKNRGAGILCDNNEQSFLGLEEMDWARSFLGNEGELGEFDFMEVLLASPQQFHFPNVREIARGTENSDLLQPGLMQLQPCFNDDFVDFHEMLARDLPTVPEEELFPEVEHNAELPPSPPSPIRTPVPSIQFSSRETRNEIPVKPIPVNKSEQYVRDNDFRQLDGTFTVVKTNNSYGYGKPVGPRSPSRDASTLSRPERSRVIARSRSQQELNAPTSSPVHTDGSQFAAPKPYARRRSHSGSISGLGSFGSSLSLALGNASSVPSLPTAVTSSAQVSSPVGSRFNAQVFANEHTPGAESSTLLAQLLTPSPDASTGSPSPSLGGQSNYKLSVLLPSRTIHSSSTTNVGGLPIETTLSAPEISSRQPVGVSVVTLSAVTPSSMKAVSTYSRSTPWSSDGNLPQSTSVSLKASPPRGIPSPPLDSNLSPQNKPFRPKNDVERVQYKEHRRKCHISAEQKRRCNIKNNFEHLHSLIPSVSHNPNSKVSKATMLHKGAEYIQQLKQERQQLCEKAETLRAEIEKLGGDISVAQSLLPATGAPLGHTRHSKLREKFENYVRERTLTNWKFYVFSLVAEPLLDSFSTSVSTCSIDDLSRSSLAWLDQHCSLNVLRPIVSNSMRKLSTTTSILTAPEFLAEETVRFVTKQEPGHCSSVINAKSSSNR